MSVYISIISSCNNNCSYCFRESEYEKEGSILEFDEVMKIFNWSMGSPRMGISGGEPTLHPDVYRICEESTKRFNTIFYSNLTCKTSLLSQLKSLNMAWLVNANVRDELFDNFESNMHYLNKMQNPQGTAFGITLTSNLEEDIGYIKKLIRLGKTYPRAVNYYRIALATPCHDKEFKLKNFDKSILEFYKMLDAENQYNIPVVYDCCINSCQLSNKVMLKILQDRRTDAFKHRCSMSRVDILSDRRLAFCASQPYEIFEDLKDYRMFADWFEAYNAIGQIVGNYMTKYQYFCKQVKNCTNKNCPGACFALTANLVKEEQKKPQVVQKWHKLRKDLLDFI